MLLDRTDIRVIFCGQIIYLYPLGLGKANHSLQSSQNVSSGLFP